MRIHVCVRCEGCGYISGGYRWEVAWLRLRQGSESEEGSMVNARACPDCGGTGALLELEAQAEVSSLPTRRGLPAGNGYVRHVASLLQSRRS